MVNTASGIFFSPASVLEQQCTKMYILLFLGAVAQLGERDVRNVEARGSIPLSSISSLMFFRERDFLT